MSAPTRRGALKDAVARLKPLGLDTPVLDARLIVQHVLGAAWNDLFLAPDKDLTADERDRLDAALARREAREPVARIVGRRHFWTLDLRVTRDTLDPRADTESLIEAVVHDLPERTTPLRILDLGTGTGAILLALLSEYPNATGLGIDVEPGAVETARVNASSHGLSSRVEFAVGNWTDGIAGPFDLIVSNPPYIPRSDIPGLAPEVREHDPLAALEGGEDGLDAYRKIIPALTGLLAAKGVAVLEIGQGQGPAVTLLAQQAGLKVTGRRADLGGIERALVLKPETG